MVNSAQEVAEGGGKPWGAVTMRYKVSFMDNENVVKLGCGADHAPAEQSQDSSELATLKE